MTTNTLKAAPAASAKELKNEKPAKAKRMLVGVDTHLRGYQAARKIDSGVIGVVENFRSEEELELYVAKQTTLAEQVVVVYEAGPLGYTLYRKLSARGVLCYVCAPESSEQRKKASQEQQNRCPQLNQQAVQLPQRRSKRVTISAGANRGAGTTADGQPSARSTGRRTQASGRHWQRHAPEPGLWELEQLVATKGLGRLELEVTALVAGEAGDLGRCAQGAR